MRLAMAGLTARLASGPADMAQILVLRAAAFPRSDGRPAPADPLDLRCQQVLIARGDAVLAAFRLLILPSGANLPGGYAARFYDLAPLAGLAGPLAELGRFCLAADLSLREGGDVLRLAWAAIAFLVDRAGATHLIGCTSLRGADWRLHRAGLQLLARQHLGPTAIRPRMLPTIPGRMERVETLHYPELVADMSFDRRAALTGLSPLLRSYLEMGAWVSDLAVMDRTLDTLHVFTCLEVAALPAARAARLRQIVAESIGEA